MNRTRSTAPPRWLWTLVLCCSITGFAALVPLARATYRTEILFNNEGWNVCNAMRVVQGQLLYPERYGWTTNNYPMLSFVLMAQLHRLTHEYLFTGRAVSLMSLLTISALVGVIVARLSQNRRAALLAGLFCFALYCANADQYVGADEPQMLAQVFFLLGLYVAIAAEARKLPLVGAALLFVAGGCVKHNLIDFPLAVLLATALQSLRRAVLFAASGVAFTAAALWMNIHFGGPHFLDQLLLPRTYSLLGAAKHTGVFIGPILLPFGIAFAMAISLRHDPRRRVLLVLLATSLVVDFYFSGGDGVSINALFSVLVDISILLGLFFGALDQQFWPWMRRPAAAWLPAVLFTWLLIPMAVNENLNAVGVLHRTAASQRRLDLQVALLRSLPGPALCESSLRCAMAGKPYLYDGFNATRLIHFGKLDPQPMLDALQAHRFSAVQMEGAVDDPLRNDRPPRMVAAIQQYYEPAFQDEDSTIFIPRRPAAH